MTNRYRCVIVDDEPLGRELIATHLSKLDQFELVASCASALEAATYLNQNKVDLLFLDIEMPVLKGTDFYQSLRHKPKVIFTTAYRDYAVEGFELEAVDYLLKPIVFARFFKAIERFLAGNTRSEKNSTSIDSREWFFIREDRKDIKINIADILFVKSLKDYVQVHTTKTVHTIKDTLYAFENRLNQDFVRVHRSYIVNRRHVTAITKYDIEIGNIEVPISDKYRDNVNARLL